MGIRHYVSVICIALIIFCVQIPSAQGQSSFLEAGDCAFAVSSNSTNSSVKEVVDLINLQTAVTGFTITSYYVNEKGAGTTNMGLCFIFDSASSTKRWLSLFFSLFKFGMFHFTMLSLHRIFYMGL